MPLKRCSKDGQRGWKWGDEGTCYVGAGARERALRQGRAIEASKGEAVETEKKQQIVKTSPDDGHVHEILFPDGIVPAGSYATSVVDEHAHAVWLDRPLEPGQSAELVTTGPSAGDVHAHKVFIAARPESAEPAAEAPDEPSPDEPETDAMPHACDGYGEDCPKGANDPQLETKVRGGMVVEVKEVARNGVPLGVFEGYLATWDADRGGVHGVPDQFVRGAFAESLADHKARGNRQIRLKDHHGKTIGGFPVDLAREDERGLFVVGEINLDTAGGREAYSLMRQGVLTDLSVGFTTLRDEIGANLRRIFKARLWEGSVVDEPANPNAKITEVKSFVDVTEAKALTVRQIEEALREGKTFSKGAARYLASRLVREEPREEVPEVVRYDGQLMSSILRDLQASRSALGE